MRIVQLIPDNRDVFKQYEGPAPTFGPAPSALLDGLCRLPGIEVHVVSCVKRPLGALTQLGPNLFHHSLVVGRWGWLRSGYLGCRRAIQRKLQELQPDVVHGQGTELYCGLAAADSPFPNVVTIHGNMRQMARKFRARPLSYLWLAGRFEASVLQRTHGVFCNSAYTEEAVRPLARRTWRVPNALQRPYLERPLTAGGAGAVPQLLNVGTISRVKCQLEVLDLAAQLHQTGRRFQLVFAGPFDDAGYAAEFMRRVREAEGQGYARYVGSQKLEAMVALMDQSAALVHFSAEESFGLVVAEALARNLKLFVARTGGVTDIVEGVAGVEVVPFGDWAAAGRALAAWLDAGAPRPRPSAGLMRERYHPEVIARRHWEIYSEIAGR